MINLRWRTGSSITAGVLLAALTVSCKGRPLPLPEPPLTTVASAATLPADFRETRIADTFRQATQMVVTPDGRVLICEQAGRVLVVKNDVLLPTPFVTLAAGTVDGTSSRGLMGIAVSPDFDNDGRVYLFYTHLGAPSFNRIIRVRASAANPDVAEVDAGGAPVIDRSYDLSPQGTSSIHNSGAMRFSGGLLYVATGDNNDRVNAQNLGHSAGKILRMTADLLPAPGNPYAASAGVSEHQKRLWARGMRNPWSMAVHPTTGVVHVSDVGSDEGAGGTPNSDGVPREEVNFVPTVASLASELDYGWPSTEGAGPNLVHTYLNAPSEDVAGSDCAVVGATFYKPDRGRFPSSRRFPSSYEGAYFFGDHCSGKIKYLPAGEQDVQTVGGSPPGATSNVPSVFATGTIQGMLDVQASPDGSLYYLTRAIIRPRDPNVNGILVKMEYTRDAIPEVCAITAPAAGTRLTAPADLTVTASASDSNGGGIQKVEFFSTTSNIPGSTPVLLGEDLAAPYQQVVTGLGQNAYRLVARCTNADGNSRDSDPVTVTVNGPTAVIVEPAEGLMYDAGDTIVVSGSASDPEDGESFPPAAFQWIIELGHGIGAGAHYHEQERFTGPSGSFVVPRTGEVDPNQFQRINLQVADSAGIFHTAVRDIFPRKSDVTLATDPPGLGVELDGVLRVTPLTFTSVVGMERAVRAPSPQTLTGRSFEWVSWSDGGAASHTLTVPASNPTVVALYRELPVITVTAPAAGARWLIGSPATVTWSHNLPPGDTVRVELRRTAAGAWETLAAAAPNSGSFAWTVTAPIAAAAVVRVTSVATPAASGTSNAFAIAEHTVRVTVPNTNVSWKIATTQTIQWTQDVGAGASFRIDLSRDGGVTWTLIQAAVTSATATAGSHAWVVSGGRTTKARIRVTWNGRPSVQDQSDVNFSIK